MNKTKYYKTSPHKMISLIKEFGSARDLIDYFDQNNLWEYKKDIKPELRSILMKLEKNKVYKVSEIKEKVNDGTDIEIKPSLLTRRLNKLEKLGYMSRIR